MQSMSCKLSALKTSICQKLANQVFCSSRNVYNAALAKVLDDVNGELHAIKEAGTWKHERVITTKQGRSKIKQRTFYLKYYLCTAWLD